MKIKTRSVAIALFIIAVFVIGLSLVPFNNANQSNSQSVYSLTLVVTTVHSDNESIACQYVFFVLENNTLTSSSVIKVPFAKKVRITIINYDNDTSPELVTSASNVSGVIGNKVIEFNSISVPQANITSGKGSNSFSMIPSADISHTFTTNTGLNIPIVPHSTEIAYTYFNSVGTYSWACMCQCGQLSMNSPGWMMGQLVVLPP